MLGYLTKTIHCFKMKNNYKMDFIIQSCRTETNFIKSAMSLTMSLVGIKANKKTVVVKCNNKKIYFVI